MNASFYSVRPPRKSLLSVHTRSEAAWHVVKIPAGYTVICDCLGSAGRVKIEDCEGLSAVDGQGLRVAVFRGKWYSAVENGDGSVDIFSSHQGRNRIERNINA
jgi:hypothetical protein